MNFRHHLSRALGCRTIVPAMYHDATLRSKQRQKPTAPRQVWFLFLSMRRPSVSLERSDSGVSKIITLFVRGNPPPGKLVSTRSAESQRNIPAELHSLTQKQFFFLVLIGKFIYINVSSFAVISILQL